MYKTQSYEPDWQVTTNTKVLCYKKEVCIQFAVHCQGSQDEDGIGRSREYHSISKNLFKFGLSPTSICGCGIQKNTFSYIYK